jgi:hypothetical protein
VTALLFQDAFLQCSVLALALMLPAILQPMALLSAGA